MSSSVVPVIKYYWRDSLSSNHCCSHSMKEVLVQGHFQSSSRALVSRLGGCTKMGIMLVAKLVEQACVRPCPECWEREWWTRLMYFFCVSCAISSPHSGRVLFLKHNQVSSLPMAESSPQHHFWVIKKKDKPSGEWFGMCNLNVGLPWSQLRRVSLKAAVACCHMQKSYKQSCQCKARSSASADRQRSSSKGCR